MDPPATGHWGYVTLPSPGYSSSIAQSQALGERLDGLLENILLIPLVFTVRLQTGNQGC